MAIDILKGSSATPLVFLLVQSADHITGLTGASPTVKLGKNGGTGAAPSGAVTEIDSTNLPGWYKVAGNATDTNTAGPLVLHATAASADPCDIMAANVIDSTVAVYGTNEVTIAGQTITAAAGVTFPSSIASPTNITAGTITTATNLTNAPTAGDFTATMKTSIGTAVAASAVASVTGNVGGNVVGSVGSVTGGVTVTTNNDKTGYVLSATGSAAMTESYAADGATMTLNQALYQIWSFLAEKNVSGTTLTAKKLDGSTGAMTFTLDSATAPTTITRAT